MIKILKYSAHYRKINFLKNNVKPCHKNNLIYEISLLELNNTDKSTYSDVIEFLDNL